MYGCTSQYMYTCKQCTVLTKRLHGCLDARRHSVDFSCTQQEVRPLPRLDHLLANLHAVDAWQHLIGLFDHGATLREALLPRKHVLLAFLTVHKTFAWVNSQKFNCPPSKTSPAVRFRTSLHIGLRTWEHRRTADTTPAIGSASLELQKHRKFKWFYHENKD